MIIRWFAAAFMKQNLQAKQLTGQLSVAIGLAMRSKLDFPIILTAVSKGIHHQKLVPTLLPSALQEAPVSVNEA